MKFNSKILSKKKLIIFLCIFEDQKPIKSDSNLEFTVFYCEIQLKKKNNKKMYKLNTIVNLFFWVMRLKVPPQ